MNWIKRDRYYVMHLLVKFHKIHSLTIGEDSEGVLYCLNVKLLHLNGECTYKERLRADKSEYGAGKWQHFTQT